ncbi:hypothetical protein [Terrihabitans sp. B22-R8]|uniref:hypothetical protein n=1 Tax=Terrihabitans sp. B22-R8 TaxID=3425128 RepID=UPI00403D2909
MTREATFTLIPRDLNQGVRLHTFSNYRQTKTIAKLVILWAVATALTFVIAYDDRHTWPERLHDAAPIAFVFAAVILGTIFGVPLLLAPLAIRKRFRQEKFLREPVTVSWDEKSYAVVHPNTQSRLAWTDYVFLRENRNVFTFAISNFNY